MQLAANRSTADDKQREIDFMMRGGEESETEWRSPHEWRWARMSSSLISRLLTLLEHEARVQFWVEAAKLFSTVFGKSVSVGPQLVPIFNA